MTIHNEFSSTSSSTDISSVEESCTSLMDTFDNLSVSEIKQLLKRTSNAFCEADSMPIEHVKECQDILTGLIAKTVNASLSSIVFPLSMKVALVKLVIKRHNLDCKVLKHYWPVSNLSVKHY